MLRFFFFFPHLSHVILREICIYKIMVQHTSDSYGRGYVSFAHYLLYLPCVIDILELCSVDPDQMLHSAASDLGLHCA